MHKILILLCFSSALVAHADPVLDAFDARARAADQLFRAQLDYRPGSPQQTAAWSEFRRANESLRSSQASEFKARLEKAHYRGSPKRTLASKAEGSQKKGAASGSTGNRKPSTPTSAPPREEVVLDGKTVPKVYRFKGRDR